MMGNIWRLLDRFAPIAEEVVAFAFAVVVTVIVSSLVLKDPIGAVGVALVVATFHFVHRIILMTLSRWRIHHALMERSAKALQSFVSGFESRSNDTPNWQELNDLISEMLKMSIPEECHDICQECAREVRNYEHYRTYDALPLTARFHGCQVLLGYLKKYVKDAK